MPKSHARYAPEYRRRMIELVRAGRSPDELAKEFEPTAQSIRNWVTQADLDEGRRHDGLSSEERQELTCVWRIAAHSAACRTDAPATSAAPRSRPTTTLAHSVGFPLPCATV